MLSYRERTAIREAEGYKNKVAKELAEKATSDTVLKRTFRGIGRGTRALFRGLWAFVNSPFVISAVIGLCVAVLSDEGTCEQKAFQHSDRYYRIAGELAQREADLFRSVANAQTDDQVKAALSSSRGAQALNRYHEFREWTLIELEEEYTLLRLQLDTSSVWLDRTARPDDPQSAYRAARKFKEEVIARSVVQKALAGEQLEMPQLKYALETLVQARPLVARTDVALAAGAQCTYRRSLRHLLGEPDETVTTP